MLYKMNNTTNDAGKSNLSTWPQIDYKTLFDNNPIPMWLVEKVDLSIIHANNAVIIQYGYSIEELLKMTINDLTDKKACRNQFTGDQGFQSPLAIVKHRKKNGAIIFVRITSYDIILDGKCFIFLITNDITNESAAKVFLKDVKGSLQPILQTPDIGYVLLDRELKTFAFNENAAVFTKERFNFKLEKEVSLTDYFPIEQYPRFIKLAINILTGYNPKCYLNYEHSGDIKSWYKIRLLPICDDTDYIIGLMISIHDITERKKAKRDLCIAYDQIANQIASIQSMAWKQSHLIRSPLANLKGLMQLLTETPMDIQVFNFIQNEIERMDAIISDLANDASKYGNL